MNKLIGLFHALIRFPIFLKAWVLAKPVSIEIASQRLIICSDCEHLDILTRQCTKCWCFIRRKVQWADESCPLKKWLKFPIKNADTKGVG